MTKEEREANEKRKKIISYENIYELAMKIEMLVDKEGSNRASKEGTISSNKEGMQIEMVRVGKDSQRK